LDIYPYPGLVLLQEGDKTLHLLISFLLDIGEEVSKILLADVVLPL
jgi:hypothetical protein